MCPTAASRIYHQKIQGKDMTEEQQYKLSKYIWEIIIYGGPVSMSWGIDTRTLRQIDNGISFHVQSLKLKGTVEIVYDEGTDYFDVSFVKDENPTQKETVENISLDKLVDVIDRRVEYTGEDYTDRIRKELQSL